jgi:hypothetical protein
MPINIDSNTVTQYEDPKGWPDAQENSAPGLVGAKFAEIEEYTDKWTLKAEDLMDELARLLDEQLPDVGDIEYEGTAMPGLPVESAPNPPDKPVFDLPSTDGMPIMRGEIEQIAVNSFDLPVDDIGDPTIPSIDFEEDYYTSLLLTSLTNTLDDIVLNGGNGLSQATMDSILDLALQKDDLKFEAETTKAENFYASRGYPAPPGALNAKLNMIGRERTRNRATIIAELSNKNSELAHEHSKFCLELSKDVEGLMMQDKNNVKERAYKLATSLVTYFQELYKLKVEKYMSSIEAYKAQWSAEETRVRAVSARNTAITDTYKAEIDGYRARLDAEFGVIESITRVFVAEMSGYESLIKAESARSSAIIERYKAMVQQDGQRAELKLKEADLILQNAFNKLKATQSAIEAMGQLAGQVTASALSAFNASASISSGFSSSENFGYSRSIGWTNSGGESMGLSKTYNYSAAAPT